MKVTVMGTGAIGGYFGARLAQGGCDVGFVARGPQLATLRAGGLKVESPLGGIVLPQVRASDDPGELGTPDLALVCVKLWDMDEAVRALAPVVGRGTAVLSLQNGVTKDDVLRRAFGSEAVMGGVVYISAGVPAPGVVRQTGTLQKLVLGEYDGSRSPRATALLEAFVRGGTDVEIHADIRRAIWEKFVFLVGISAATSATRSTIGPVRSHPRSRAFLHDVMREVVAVGRAHGVPLAADYADERLAFCDRLAPEMEASMCTDLRQGRRLELPWLSGAVVRMGRELGVPTPVHEFAAALLGPFAGGRR